MAPHPALRPHQHFEIGDSDLQYFFDPLAEQIAVLSV